MIRFLGILLIRFFRFWIRIVGRTVIQSENEWLASPFGKGIYIGDHFYDELAKEKDLRIEKENAAGLLQRFDDLKSENFDPDKVQKGVRHFYEHTSEYELEAWSESMYIARLFLWIVTRLTSRIMNQLNFPVSSLELAKGMSSEILPMYDKEGKRIFTGWLRKLIDTNRVVYTGLYSVEVPPFKGTPCVKVTFPLPKGSSSVFLFPSVEEDGSFRLTSSGQQFGDAGFYRMVERNDKTWKIRFMKTLREYFHVYEADGGIIRTDHHVYFLGMKILKLHYKIVRKGG